MTCPPQHFFNAGVSSFAWGVRQIVRHPSRFSHAAPLTFQCSRRAINTFPSRDYSNLAVADGVGNCARTVLFVALIGNLHGLNAFGFALYINRIEGYSPCI